MHLNHHSVLIFFCTHSSSRLAQMSDGHYWCIQTLSDSAVDISSYSCVIMHHDRFAIFSEAIWRPDDCTLNITYYKSNILFTMYSMHWWSICTTWKGALRCDLAFDLPCYISQMKVQSVIQTAYMFLYSDRTLVIACTAAACTASTAHISRHIVPLSNVCNLWSCNFQTGHLLWISCY